MISSELGYAGSEHVANSNIGARKNKVLAVESPEVSGDVFQSPTPHSPHGFAALVPKLYFMCGCNTDK